MSEKNLYKQIYLCSSDLEAEELARDIGVYYGIDAVRLTDDPCLLRRALDEPDATRLVVVDSIQGSMDARNIAQALIMDGHSVALLLDGKSEDEFEYVENAIADKLQIVARSEVIGDRTKQESKPAKDIEIPEEEFAWESLRSSLQQIAGRYSKGIIGTDFDGLDEVEGVAVSKTEKESTAPTLPQPVDKGALKGKAIAFCSGRGGVGKTTLISMAGVMASSWGLKVALLDLDLFCGNLFMHYGEPSIASLTSIKDVDGNVEKLKSDYMQKVSKTSELYLYGALDHPEEAELVFPYYEHLLNSLLQTFDLVLVDMPKTWNEHDVRILRQVDRMIVVADERASSVSSMIRTMNLANRLGVVRTKMIRLINRCDSYGFDQKFIQKAEEGSYCPHTYYVEDGGRQVGEMLSEGKVSNLVQTRNACVRTWSQALNSILKDIGITIDKATERDHDTSLASSIFSIFKPHEAAALGKA